VIVVPTLERIDRQLVRKLRLLAMRNVQVLVGPEIPTHDEWGDPLGQDEGLPDGVSIFGTVEDLMKRLARLPKETWQTRSDHATCDVFHDENGVARLVFVGADTERALLCQIDGERNVVLVDCFTGERFSPDASSCYKIPVLPHDVRMLRVERNA
jgi:hypothetical protein